LWTVKSRFELDCSQLKCQLNKLNSALLAALLRSDVGLLAHMFQCNVEAIVHTVLRLINPRHLTQTLGVCFCFASFVFVLFTTIG